MIDTHTLKDLFRHMEWADALVWTTALSSPEAAADSIIRDRLYHIHLVQRAFLREWQSLRGESRPQSFADSESVARWGQAYHAEARSYLATLDETTLARPLVVPWAAMVEARLGRRAEAPSHGETALQVVMHSTYHRGQVNTRLRELGCAPPLTDYIVWLWLGKPAPQWPALSLDDGPN